MFWNLLRMVFLDLWQTSSVRYGMDILVPYMKTIGACYLTCALFTIFVQGGLMVGLYGKISPIRFFSVMKEAILFVFATCSSVATIPLNLKCTKELGVSDKIADFVIPFGAVMNMNGTAIYEAVAVIFASQVFGIHLTVTQQIMVMLTADSGIRWNCRNSGFWSCDADDCPECSQSSA